MTKKLNELFDNWGLKSVSKTDKSKSAYVPNKEQKRAILSAGIKPSPKQPHAVFEVKILNDQIQSIKTNYYHSKRSAKAKRAPEPRMGLKFITSWLDIGDMVLIGNIGSDLFSCKLRNKDSIPDHIDENVYHAVSDEVVFSRANRSSKKPVKRKTIREEYSRNPYVVEAALRRSGGVCEMSGCGNVPFYKDSEEVYLEVHHIVPLSIEGDDSLSNVAALCPNCHREQHYGVDRVKKIALLKTVIAKKS